MIQLVNINKYYYMGRSNKKDNPNLTYHALKDINVCFGDSGMNFILGKSGSGKSTLLNIIGGIDKYDSGELIIDNVNTKDFNSKDYNTYRNTYIGFVFQEFNVLKGLSVYDNIALSLELKHQNVKKSHELILEVIEKVGLKGLENRMMNEISGGQRQRVAIARALIKNPRVIIADEPTGNLDSNNSKMVMDLLKELSKEHLIIIVTHNDLLAEEYADRIIKLKDGKITSDTLDTLPTDTPLKLERVKVPVKTSLNLAFKSALRNKIRFIFIILLFSVSLMFAGVVINLWLADTTSVYAKYQADYNNYILNTKKEYTSHGITSHSAFYFYEVNKQEKDYALNNPQITIIKGMEYEIPIDQNSLYDDEIYANSIGRINIWDGNVFTDNDISTRTQYSREWDQFTNISSTLNIAITDYVAQNLIVKNYFGSAVKKDTDLINKEITMPGFNNPLIIKGIIRTDFSNLMYTLNTEDSNELASFKDNLLLYNSIFMVEGNYKRIFGVFDEGAEATRLSNIQKAEKNYEINPSQPNYNALHGLYVEDNVNYIYDDFIFSFLKNEGFYENIKVTTYDQIDENTNRYPISQNNISCEPVKPAEGQQIQIALSSGFLKKVLNLEGDLETLYSNCVFEMEVLTSTGETKTELTSANIYLNGVSRVPVPITAKITQIIEDEEPIVIMPRKNNYNLFKSYLSNSCGNGNFLTLKVNNLAGGNDAIKQNALLYRSLIDNNIRIDNIAFQKILLVDNFIKDNLWLFIGIFFVFGLFSILLIFNFVIINIKNSTRDIGIYMSLGMSGFKISLIYFFQVIFIGLTAFIIATIGTFTFLKVLDARFTAMSMVNLEVIKLSIVGSLVVALFASIIPTSAIVVPLINLMRKRPVDVIKSI
ncbi:MAG: ABC transporter ATP-binding protein/permease [Bacilli bacterium]|nr:ABC transporter ATP-binding protein/permease [Bacilli bacterium]